MTGLSSVNRAATCGTYDLGIDLGTSSVALAAIAIENDRPTGVMASDLVIFGEPIVPKTMKLKNEARRLARTQRRNLDRARARTAKILHIAKSVGVSPQSLSMVIGGRKNSGGLPSTKDIWRLRAEAVDPNFPLSLDQFFAVMLRVSKNRGYKGSIPEQAQEKYRKKKDAGKVGDGTTDYFDPLIESEALFSDGKTLGQVVWESMAGQPDLHHARGRKLTERGTYVLRSRVEREFDLIVEAQSKHLPCLSEPIPGGVRPEHYFGQSPQTLAQALRVAIFHQAPVRLKPNAVGECSLEGSGFPRAPSSHPVAQTFRIEKTLGDLRWGRSKSGQPLSRAQKDLIREALNAQKQITFSEIYRRLDRAGIGSDGEILNFDTSRQDALKGNQTLAAFRSLGLLEEFEALSPQDQSAVIMAWVDCFRSKESWTLGSHRMEVERLFGASALGFLDLVDGAAKDGIDWPTKFGMPAGRSAYGLKALEKLSAYMRDNDVDEHTAIQALYPQSQAPRPLQAVLPEVYDPNCGRPPKDDELQIFSPVVRRAVIESRRAIQKFMDRYGMPRRIVLELAREMKVTLGAREALSRSQAARQRANDQALQDIESLGWTLSRSSVTRHRLWKEQAGLCPYSGQTIELEDALNEATTQIDHIVPQRRRGVGNRVDEVVLCLSRMNALKGAHDTAYRAHLSRPGQWAWEATETACSLICRRNPAFKAKAKQILDTTLLEYTHASLNESEQDFVDQQLQDTAYISRVMLSFCQAVCSDVTVIRGQLTEALRRAWGLDSVLEEARVNAGLHPKLSKSHPIAPGGPGFDDVTHRIESAFYKRRMDSGALVFNKRADHRHHLVDAAVIALSSRSMYVRFSEFRVAMQRDKEAGASRLSVSSQSGAGARRPRFPAPWDGLRDDVRSLIAQTVVWHKPDRLVNGELFNANPAKLHADGASLSVGGKLQAMRFSAARDKVVSVVDRLGRRHSKVLISGANACLQVDDANIRCVPLHAVDRSQLGCSRSTSGTRFIFKNDLVWSPDKRDFYRVVQVLSSGGLKLVRHCDTITYSDGQKTSAIYSVSNEERIRDLVVLPSQRALGRFIAQMRSQKECR